MLDRITGNVHRLNEALLELNRSVIEINNYNEQITITAELSEAVRVIAVSICRAADTNLDRHIDSTAVTLPSTWRIWRHPMQRHSLLTHDPALLAPLSPNTAAVFVPSLPLSIENLIVYSS